MQQVRASTHLDAEWRLHLLVVQGRITCSPGTMYDSIGAPPEGVVSYSDDGYPRAHSVNFGAAEGRMQVGRGYGICAHGDDVTRMSVHGFSTERRCEARPR